MNPVDKRIAVWLTCCCALIFAMVVLGGVTRLTHSGLSITEWKPILGALPPFGEAGWLEVFSKYQQTPEYRLVNQGMELEAFKRIFWVEYAHRLLGRTIGAAFLLPFLYFLATGQLSRRILPQLAGIFALGGLQGALGWYMVKSGLTDVPWVSPYRLTAHLALAFLLYAWILRLLLSILPLQEDAVGHPRLLTFSRSITGLVFLMVIAGGLVAGTKAGYAFNTFPKMEGLWVPAGMLTLEPLLRNFFENIITVQFQHRLLALVLTLSVVMFWWSAQRSSLAPWLRWMVHLLPGILAVQLILGVTTLLFHVPVPLAAAHQAGALVLFTNSWVIQHALSARGRVATSP